MTRLFALALLLAGGCKHVTHYTIVSNGGTPSLRGTCSELALADVQGQLRVIPPGSPGCDTVDAVLVPAGTTFAIWQIGGSSLAGPANANAVIVKVPMLGGGEGSRGLASGESQRGLTSGENQRGLRSGESQRGLATGENQRALAAGENQRGLRSGENERALSAGESQRGLRSGENERALATGEKSRSLDVGQQEKPVLAIQKRANSDYTTTEHPVTFTIDTHNVGAAPLARVVVVDRLARQLALVDDGGAGVQALPDGSTLMIWTLPGPWDADARLPPIKFSVVPRPGADTTPPPAAPQQ